MIMNRIIVVTLLLLSSIIPAYTFTINQIRDPRPECWVLDDKKYLSEDSRTALNSICREIKDSGNGEIMVVVVDKIGSDNHRRFATDIFNRLGIGERGTNRGILLYAAIEEHAAEIILGDGVDNSSAIASSDKIMQNTLIPYFKKGEFDNALYYGAVECAQQILNVQIQKTFGEGITDSGTGLQSDSCNKTISDGPKFKRPEGLSRVIANIIIWGLFYLLLVRPFLRLLPRKCPKCKKKMVRLSESEDDMYLAKGEITEEHFKSVNYDVWYCNDCKVTRKVKRGKLFSGYSKCPQCKYKTLKRTTRVIHHATTYSEGLQEVDLNCRNCSFTKNYTVTIARVSDSDSSSSGSSSSGGGSSSGSGSSGRW
jgi:uncharacterized protein